MSESKKIALFGGSFDPVHKGHIHAAIQVGKKLNLDKVVFMPSYKNPLKSGGAHTGADMRLDMLELATSKIPGLEASSMEIEKKTVSYTVDTLRSWKTRREKNSLWFLMGEDLFSDVTKWKDFREIFQNSNVAVISRPGFESSSRGGRKISPEPPPGIKRDFLPCNNGETETVSFRHKNGSKLLFMEIDALDISSTEIRNRVKNGIAFEHLVTQEVGDFIKRNNLYAKKGQV